MDISKGIEDAAIIAEKKISKLKLRFQNLFDQIEY